MAKILILVNSDIVADQRVNRTASTLVDEGHSVMVIGRKLSFSPKYFKRKYKIKLLNLPFKKGVLFYASFNLVAFFNLLFRNFDLLHANDLDSLLAARFACFMRRKALIYDSHELFTELPELLGSKTKRRIWYFLEYSLTRGLKYCSTVSKSIAEELFRRYGIRCEVIRNLPLRRSIKHFSQKESINKVILYQGALNKGRGLEKLIEAMQWIDNAKLLVYGTGDIEKQLASLSLELNLTNRIDFKGRVSLEELNELSVNATLGVSLEEDMGLNYRFALPNKLFDYIQSGLPVLASNLPEMASIVHDYDIGQTILSNCTPKILASKLNKMMEDDVNMQRWSVNSLAAAQELNWDMEKVKLITLTNKALEYYTSN